MRTMYTKKADSLCYEHSEGIYARVAQSAEERKLLAKGWVYNISDFPENKAATQKQADADQKQAEVNHEKMKEFEAELEVLKAELWDKYFGEDDAEHTEESHSQEAQEEKKAEVVIRPEMTAVEMAEALGIPTEVDGKKIHHKTLIKQVKEHGNNNEG